MIRVLTVLTFVIVMTAFVVPAAAEVVRFEITSREVFAADVPGKIGSYERIRGRVIYALDPSLEANKRIVDLALAPRDDDGRVVFYADVEILAPIDLSQAQPTILYNINNRGRRTWGGEPFLLSRGYITVSSGWIAEVPVNDRLLRIEAPVALDEHFAPISGWVTVELLTDVPTKQLSAGDRSQLSYEPLFAEIEEARLTHRERAADPPQVIPRGMWQLESRPPQAEGSGLVEAKVTLNGGFEPGVIYQLSYVATGSVVQGTGFAAIRDLVSFLKYDTSEKNPLRGAAGLPIARRAIGEGRSQSGRALRTFLYEGFNADEQDRQVFEGLLPQIAGGGRGYFNHRFASPTQTSTQHDGHLYPVDLFPFTYGDETDPYTGRTEGILGRSLVSGTVPKVMHLDTTSEYWHRSGSLVVMDPKGERDSVVPDEVRVYVFGGSQHSPARRLSGRGQQLPNPNDYRPLSEALFVALDRWITDDTDPPPSVHPLIAEGTLVGWQAEHVGWTPLPGVRYPSVIQQPEYFDYGDDFLTMRRIDHHPPKRTDEHYRVRVPAIDADNNERGVLQLPSVAVPVATYTGWNLRSPSIGASTELLSLTGSYLPFAKTAVEREASGDQRRSIAERYRDFDDYLSQYMKVAEELVERRHLLPEHLDGIEEVALGHKGLFER